MLLSLEEGDTVASSGMLAWSQKKNRNNPSRLDQLMPDDLQVCHNVCVCVHWISFKLEIATNEANSIPNNFGFEGNCMCIKQKYIYIYTVYTWICVSILNQ